MIEIEVRRRWNDFHACFAGQPALWGCGRTIDEAVGSVTWSHQEKTGVRLSYPGETGVKETPLQPPGPVEFAHGEVVR